MGRDGAESPGDEEALGNSLSFWSRVPQVQLLTISRWDVQPPGWWGLPASKPLTLYVSSIWLPKKWGCAIDQLLQSASLGPWGCTRTLGTASSLGSGPSVLLPDVCSMCNSPSHALGNNPETCPPLLPCLLPFTGGPASSSSPGVSSSSSAHPSPIGSQSSSSHPVPLTDSSPRANRPHCFGSPVLLQPKLLLCPQEHKSCCPFDAN